jgi:CheY-like chemotaxis protein
LAIAMLSWVPILCDEHGDRTIMTPRNYQVLLAEDNQGDVFLVREALRVHGIPFEMHVASDGPEVESYIESLGRKGDDPLCPDVFLLDLNLPKVDGHEILREFRQHPVCSEVPVVVITSSDSPKDRERARLLGATVYFRKPSDLAEYMTLGSVVRELLGANAGAHQATGSRLEIC